jgi:hypothetical protein
MCDGAIGKGKSKGYYSKNKLMRLQYDFPVAPRLKYLNSGAGTTGTRSLFRFFCSQWNVESLHYAVHCRRSLTKESNENSKRNSPETLTQTSALRNKLLMWYNHLTKCTVNPRNNCTSNEILTSLRERLPSILTDYVFLSDTPIDMLFLEIYAAMKFQVRVFATLRQPMNWASRRVEEHPNTLICRQELWNQSSVYHPFDILGCLSSNVKVEVTVSSTHPTKFFRMLSQPSLN